MQLKTANGKTFVKMSHAEWEQIGVTHGWFSKEAKLKQTDIKKFLEWQATQVSPTQPVPLAPPAKGGRGPSNKAQADKPMPLSALKGIVQPTAPQPTPSATKPQMPAPPQQAADLLSTPSPELTPGAPDPSVQGALMAPDPTPADQKTPATQAMDAARKDLAQVPPQALKTPQELAEAKRMAALLAREAKNLDSRATEQAGSAMSQQMRHV